MARFCTRAFGYYWQIGDRSVSLGWDEPTWLDYVAFQFQSFERFVTEEEPLAFASDLADLEADLAEGLASADQEAAEFAHLLRQGVPVSEAHDRAADTRTGRPSREVVLEILAEDGDSSDACSELEGLLTEDRWICPKGDEAWVVSQIECAEGESVGPA